MSRKGGRIGCPFCFYYFCHENQRMKPALLSIAYFPPISWMAVALQAGRITLEIHETYPKQTFRNRCVIATASGLLNLTVPVKRINGNHTKTVDIQIDNSKNWQLLHWRSINTAYNKSPYFLYYRDVIEPLFFKKYKYLVDFNRELLQSILNMLKINTIEILYTHKYEFEPGYADLRNSFHPKYPNRDINCNFPRYIQVFEEAHGFLPDLSIMDLLFNMGPDALHYLKRLDLSVKQ